MHVSPAKRKRAPREGEGRPARTGDGASTNFVVRVSATERARLRELAARFSCTEAEAGRHLMFHDGAEPGCKVCAESGRVSREMIDAFAANGAAITAAIADVSKRAAAKMRAKRARKPGDKSVQELRVRREGGDTDTMHLCGPCEASTDDFLTVLGRSESSARCDRCEERPRKAKRGGKS